jgi:hypothetical protein
MFAVCCFKAFIDPYTSNYIEIAVLIVRFTERYTVYNGFYIGYATLNVTQALIPVWRRVRIPPPQSLRRRGNTVSDETVMYGYWSSVTGLDL